LLLRLTLLDALQYTLQITTELLLTTPKQTIIVVTMAILTTPTSPAERALRACQAANEAAAAGAPADYLVKNK